MTKTSPDTEQLEKKQELNSYKRNNANEVRKNAGEILN
jgi:hypothetical protein